MVVSTTDDRLFHAVFEGALDALLLADDEGTYIDANGAAAELFGSPTEELVGQSIAEFVSAEMDLQAAWRAFLEERDARGQLEIRRSDGDVRAVESAWSNVETAEATLEIGYDLGSILGEEGRILQLFENLFLTRD